MREIDGKSARVIPLGLNLSLAAIHLLLNFYMLFLLPLYLLPASRWWVLTLVAIAGLSNTFWSLVHEAIHDMLHPSHRINVAAGRLLSVFFGSPFRVLRLSHLMHHKLNRTPTEGTELYDPAKTSRVRARLGYYFQILGGLYFFEVASVLPFFLPRRVLRFLERRYFSRDTLSGILVRGLFQEDSIREMRTDGGALMALFSVSFWCYGGYWQFLVMALVLRAFLISFLDNVYHYKTPVNDVFYASNLRLPQTVSKALLHFNLHGIHHRNTSIPWTRLPEAFQRESSQFDGNYFTAALRQLSGPIAISDLPRLG